MKISEYSDKVWKYFVESKATSFILSQLVSLENKDLFIQCIELMNQQGYDIQNGFIIKVSGDNIHKMKFPKIHGIYSINQLVYKENEALFIECVKILMYSDVPKKHNFGIDFNSDYTKINKYHADWTK